MLQDFVTFEYDTENREYMDLIWKVWLDDCLLPLKSTGYVGASLRVAQKRAIRALWQAGQLKLVIKWKTLSDRLTYENWRDYAKLS